MLSPKEILQKYWGYNNFRPQQEAIITSVLQQKNCLAILPTGGGKSICYQLPALMLNGVTLVITPLVALMQDQVERLKRLNIPAAYISAGMHYTEINNILNNTSEGAYKLLYVSPERLQTDLFNKYLPTFNLQLIAVDEAHCISQWGHDFRPDYLKIAQLKKIFTGVPLIAVTASATLEVQTDITQQLQLKDVLLFKQSFERDNIHYQIKYSEQKNKDLQDLLSNNKGSSIIYCRSRRQTELIHEQLLQVGYNALPYHAGMDKEKRKENQQLWQNNTAQIMVATTAFGMGIDKPDVRSVIHYDLPEHIEAYYQESGRAGRDGKDATAMLLYNYQDINRLNDSIDIQFPSISFIRKVYQSVVEYLQIAIGTEPYKYYDFDIADFCKKFKLLAPATARALKLLEQEGLWTLGDAIFKPTTIQIIADRNEIDSISKTYHELGLVLVTLLRLYNNIFYHPVAVNTKVIAKHLKTKYSLTTKLLQQLHKMELIVFTQPADGTQLFFHHYRVGSKDLIIDVARIKYLKAAYQKRTEYIIKFVSGNSTCRTQTILNYFGQDYNNPCGHCDVCDSDVKQNDVELNANILTILTKHNELTVAELNNQLNQYNTEALTQTIRQMIDDQTLGLTQQGKLYKKN